jgi:ATP-dependent Clp protease protease subunit
MAKLKLHSEIVDEETRIFYDLLGFGRGEQSFTSVDELLAGMDANDNTIEMSIDCVGGNVDEGIKIYDALRASGKDIKAEVVGECSSMATIVFLAAPKQARRCRPHARFLIHNPYYPSMWGKLTEDVLRDRADELKAYKESFLNIYEERTGADRITLASMMDEDKFFTADKAIELGFVSSVIEPNTASRRKSNTIINMSFLSKLKETIAQMKASSSTEYECEEGTLTVEREDGEIEVGDAASPDGTFTLSDGTKVTVEDGVVTEVTEPEEKETEVTEPEEDKASEEHAAEDKKEAITEVERMKATVKKMQKDMDAMQKRAKDAEAQVEALKTELETAKAEAKSEEDKAILEAVNLAGGEKFLSSLKSTYTVSKRSVQSHQIKKVNDMSVKEYSEFKKNRNKK